MTAELEKGLGSYQEDKDWASTTIWKKNPLYGLQAKLKATGTFKTFEYQRMLSVPIATHLCTNEATY